MKNLESFGVRELNAKELKEIDGGIIGLLIGCAIILLATNCGGAPGCAVAKAVYEDRP